MHVYYVLHYMIIVYDYRILWNTSWDEDSSVSDVVQGVVGHLSGIGHT